MKDFLKKSKLESFMFPVMALFILIVGVPFLIKYNSVHTTKYVFFFTVGFFVILIRIISLLNLHIKFIDILLTIPIIIITSVLLLILGFFSVVAVMVYPKLVYKIGYILSLITLFVLGVNLNFKGRTAPKNGQFVRIANHTSFIDELLIVVTMRKNPWTIIFANEIKRIPFFGKMLRDHGVSVDRENETSKKIAFNNSEKAIKAGKNFALFPEGRRLRPRELEGGMVLYPFKDGAFNLACKYHLPVYPVVFNFPLFYKPRSGRWWFSPRTITIINLEPVTTVGKTSEEVKNEVYGVMERTLRVCLNINAT